VDLESKQNPWNLDFLISPCTDLPELFFIAVQFTEIQARIQTLSSTLGSPSDIRLQLGIIQQDILQLQFLWNQKKVVFIARF
jgi:hypothetical protein